MALSAFNIKEQDLKLGAENLGLMSLENAYASLGIPKKLVSHLLFAFSSSPSDTQSYTSDLYGQRPVDDLGSYSDSSKL